MRNKPLPLHTALNLRVRRRQLWDRPIRESGSAEDGRTFSSALRRKKRAAMIWQWFHVVG
jgi:hypothetical protein